MNKNIFLSLLLICGSVFCVEQKKIMKILMVVAAFPKIHDVCILNQITGLIDRGHDVHIYALRKGDFVNLQEDVVTYNLIDKTMFALPSCLDDYDIVIFQLGHKIFDIRKTHNFKGKIVVRLLGYDVTAFLKENPHAYDQYFETCDLFMPVCNAFQKLLVQAGCNPDKIDVVHSRIDCSKFRFEKKDLPRQGTINIISAGRFVEKKGFFYSIQAIASLIKKYPQIRYKIIGEGVLKEKYKELINQMGLSDKITIDGWYSHAEYVPILHNSHIFVLSSVTAENNDQEGIPNVLIEAMATGLITIATDHSGNSELIEHGLSGFLVPERNSDAISATIEYVINNPKMWSSIQHRALTKIYAEFEKERENDKLEAILYRLLGA